MTEIDTHRLPLPAPFASGPAATQIQRDVIIVSGPDTEAFLQGQLSQDCAALRVGSSAWSLLLQPQGKIDAWLRVSRTDDDRFLLDLDAGAGSAALERLQRFKLRTACELVLETWTVVAVRGRGSAALDVVDAPGLEVAAPSEWPGVDGVDLLGRHVEVPPGLDTAGPSALESLRILSGVPAMGAELDARTIPAEAGIVERSVSFTKGCYTGQELVARIDSRGGNVPRRLRGIISRSDDALPVGAEIVVAGETVGAITSAEGAVGLGYVKRSVDMLPAVGQVAGAEVAICDLPMI